MDDLELLILLCPLQPKKNKLASQETIARLTADSWPQRSNTQSESSYPSNSPSKKPVINSSFTVSGEVIICLGIHSRYKGHHPQKLEGQITMINSVRLHISKSNWLRSNRIGTIQQNPVASLQMTLKYKETLLPAHTETQCRQNRRKVRWRERESLSQHHPNILLYTFYKMSRNKANKKCMKCLRKCEKNQYWNL